MRVHFLGSTMTYRQADTLLYYLENKSEVISAKVYERTGDAVIRYKGERRRILEMLRSFCYDKVVVPNEVLETSGRALNAAYQEKIIDKILFRWMRKWFLPYPMTALYTAAMSVKYIYQGLKILCKGKIEVPVLDATAIGVSILRNDFDTASSIMFFLSIGELLEEWTHKKSVDDLARMMSLNVEKVWIKKNDQEILVAASTVKKGDLIVVHMGNVIPFDGTVIEGEAMINQAALTGESVPVRRSSEDSVYAGTVLEEGEITLRVEKTGGSSRFEKIVTMIEASEKLKSSLEGKAEHLADQLVPYTFAGTGLVYLLTRNVTKALSVLMVDFSCAMKLAMPISVLSAIREASKYHLTVKGGKYLEAVAEADTIVFDKTGTLTKAHPTVVDVISFNGDDPDELLRVAACMEEHFPHSMAKAVVYAAKKRNLDGIIVIGMYPDEFYQQMKKTQIPIVLIDSYCGDHYYHSIRIDDAYGSYLAAKHLLSHGHRKIAFFCGQIKENGVMKKRLIGFQQALEEYGVPYQEQNIFEGQIDYRSGIALAKELVSKKLTATAIVCAADILAIGAIRGLYEEGLRVPEDYSVIGFDDLEVSQYLTPGLTTVRQQISLKGQKAVELLLKHIEDPTLTKQEEILPLQLVERESVRTI